MRFMFIIQGDGRGHITQAITLAEMLEKNGHEIVETLVGKAKVRELPEFMLRKFGERMKVFEAPSLIFKNNKKNINLMRTFLYNTRPDRIRKYGETIGTVKDRIEANKPDVVLNFYEMLSNLTYLRFNIKAPLVNIGHQYLARRPDYAHAKGDDYSLMIFRLHTLLCGIEATRTLALSFYPMSIYKPRSYTVTPPLIRKEVRELKPTDGDYILGYMVNHGYEKEVNEWHKLNPEVKLHFFWDKKNVPETLVVDEALTYHTLDDHKFLQYMAACRGYISTAGFESICEAMYLNKPVMVIPAHVEQEINARDAASTGNVVVGSSFDISKLITFINTNKTDNTSFRQWADCAEEIFIKQIESLQ